MKLKIFMNFSIIHILDTMKIDFILNSTFENNLLVTNIVFKEIVPLKLLQVCFVLNNWVKDEPKSRPKISFFKKLNLALFIAHPAGAPRNLNNKTSSNRCRILLCTHKYPFCGIRLTTSDRALKNPNVRTMDF